MNPETTNREWVQLWDQFIEKARGRLEDGAAQYRDESFSMPAAQLIKEIEEEILDVVTWSFILAVKLASIDGRISGQGATGPPPDQSDVPGS